MEALLCGIPLAISAWRLYNKLGTLVQLRECGSPRQRLQGSCGIVKAYVCRTIFRERGRRKAILFYFSSHHIYASFYCRALGCGRRLTPRYRGLCEKVLPYIGITIIFKFAAHVKFFVLIFLKISA